MFPIPNGEMMREKMATVATNIQSRELGTGLSFVTACSEEDIPFGVGLRQLVSFLHRVMKPYEDSATDIERGLEYALSDELGKGGFIILAFQQTWLVGAVVVLKTGMGGYVPPNLLLFIAVEPEMRGMGIGRKLLLAVKDRCVGGIVDCSHF